MKDHKLEARSLLADQVHLNAHGEWLMAECVKACLRRSRARGESPAERWVSTLELGRDVYWTGDVLKVTFVGNRVDALFGASEPDSADVPKRALSQTGPPVGASPGLM